MFPQFTRRRRWQRRAILTEIVQHLPADPAAEPLTSPNLKASPAAPVVSDKKTVSAEVIKARVLAEVPSPIPEELEDDPNSVSASANGSPKRSMTHTISTESMNGLFGEAKDGSGAVTTATAGGARDDVLRMRLKKAMGNMGA